MESVHLNRGFGLEAPAHAPCSERGCATSVPCAALSTRRDACTCRAAEWLWTTRATTAAALHARTHQTATTVGRVPRRRPLERFSGGTYSAGARTRLAPEEPRTQGLASQLFAASLIPYLAFLYVLRKAQGPPLTFFGFAFLLVFVFATIPAGIYGACCGLWEPSAL